MLNKSKTALLISSQPSFTEPYKKLADENGIVLNIEAEWNIRYRVKEDVVILGGKHLDKLHSDYYNKAVVILREGESPSPYIAKGINRFIFNYQNKDELLFALYYEEPVFVLKASREVADSVADSGLTQFTYGEYDFKFDRDMYTYKGRPIYLCSSQKKYLAEWLLAGKKDNAKRMILCNLRKKFGENFLKNVDRFGQIKGGR